MNLEPQYSKQVKKFLKNAEKVLVKKNPGKN